MNPDESIHAWWDGRGFTACNPHAVIANTGTTPQRFTARGNQVYQGDQLVCIAVDHPTAQRIARALGQEVRS